MSMKRIRLELARCPEYPDGNRRCGYEFSAPLSADDRLDPEEWRSHRKACTVRRFWEGEGEEHGRLIHTGQSWRFHYDAHDPDEDEPLYKLDRHIIREGEYLSITEQDGTVYPFKVVRITAPVK
jgi:hypothetical protein